MPLDQFKIFFVIAIVATLITLLLAVRARSYRSVPGVKFFIAMMLNLAVWTSTIAFGMVAPNEQTALFWIILRMVGVILSPLFWFLFVLQFSDREKWLQPWLISVYAIIPTISILLLITNQSHHLFIQNYGFVQYGPYLIDETWQLGSYFWIHFAYSYFLTLTGAFFLLQEAYILSHTYRRQAVLLVLATISPLVVNVLFSFHLLPALKVNYDPLGLVLAGVFIGSALYFNKLFDLTPIARRILVENMLDGMVVVNENNRIVDINPAAIRIFSLDLDSIGTDVQPSIIDRLILEPPAISGSPETYIFHPQGKNASYGVEISPIYSKGRILGKLITARDITDQKRVESQLHHLAITDSLTGLTNHRHFYELLRLEVNRARRLQHPLTAIFFDIDRFKKVNDQYGHLVGDQILRNLAQTCKNELRPYDIFARYGGEEFIILMPETDLKDAYVIAERIRTKIENHTFDTNSGELCITISLGISQIELGDEFNSFEDLIEQADEAMYHSKKSGRNKTSLYQKIVT